MISKTRQRVSRASVGDAQAETRPRTKGSVRATRAVKESEAPPPRRGAGRKKFQYKARGADQVERRATQSARDFAVIIREDIAMFKPDGEHRVRILPPTWEDPDDFGLDVYVHYGIGPDEEAYICPKQMQGDPCPICEERSTIERTNENEQILRDLAPVKRVMTWIIDRDAERDGPKIWSMPVTVDRAINKLIIDRRTGEVLPIDDPDEGYDVEFSREGVGLRTKYEAIQIVRRSSPLADDPDLQENWIDLVVDNPIPDILVYHDYDTINAAFSGSPSADRADNPVESDAEPEPGSGVVEEWDEDPPFTEESVATEEEIEADVVEDEELEEREEPPPRPVGRRRRVSTASARERLKRE